MKRIITVLFILVFVSVTQGQVDLGWNDFQLGGYFEAGYIFINGDAVGGFRGPVYWENSSGRFEFNYLRLKIAGHVIPDYRLELRVDGDGGEEMHLNQAWLTWDRYPQLRVHIGKFDSPAAYLTPPPPDLLTYQYPFADWYHTVPGLGLMIDNLGPGTKYAVAVLNGDNEGSTQIQGRLGYQVRQGSWSGSEFCVFGYADLNGEGDSPAAEHYPNYFRVGGMFDVGVDRIGWRLAGGYVTGTEYRLVYEGPEIQTEPWSAYCIMSQQVGKKLKLLVQYDMLETDFGQDISLQSRDRWTAGCLILPNQYLKFKLNYWYGYSGPGNIAAIGAREWGLAGSIAFTL